MNPLIVVLHHDPLDRNDSPYEGLRPTLSFMFLQDQADFLVIAKGEADRVVLTICDKYRKRPASHVAAMLERRAWDLLRRTAPGVEGWTKTLAAVKQAWLTHSIESADPRLLRAFGKRDLMSRAKARGKVGDYRFPKR